jgi:tetratricopeptide (TPR) repeat protein
LGELEAFPSGRALELLRLGHAPLAADLAWLRAIQYYGQHRLSDQRYDAAGHLFDVITRLDPRFEEAYVFGALVLAEDVGDAEAADRLLTRGMARCPESWWLRFERGFLRWIHRGWLEAGARDMERASRLPGAPGWVARLAAGTYERAGDLEAARRIWERLASETTNPRVREIAERALDRIRGRRADAS